MQLITMIIAFLASLFNTSPPSPLLNSGERRYSVATYEVTSANLVLIPNYLEKKSSKKLIEENGCTAGINGGFYGEDGKPQGLVVVNFKQVANKKTSQLFNGFVWAKNGKLGIDRDAGDNPEYTVQTGPLLFESGRQINLQIKNDRSARRMVSAKVANDRTFFLSFYDPNSKLDGPKLADLPGELAQVAKEKGWEVEWATNLDGGSASSFYSPDITLSELLPVGSWWCVK